MNPRLHLVAQAGLALLLGLEVAWLSVSFDTSVLSAGETWWLRAAGDIPALLRILFAFAGALTLMVAPRLGRLAEVAAREEDGFRKALALGVHVCATLVFAKVTGGVFAEAEAARMVSAGRFAAWVLAGAGWAMSWLWAVAPARFWEDLARREWRALAIAALAGTVAWLGGIAAQFLWKPLGVSVFWLSRGLLGWFYPDVVAHAGDLVLGTPRFIVQINQQCSGYEGLALIVVFLAVYLRVFRDELRFPHVLLLLPVGMAAMWLANAVRITLLIAIGSSLSRDMALGGFHSQAGWMAFVLIALGLILLAHRARAFMPKADTGARPASPPSRRTEAAAATAMLLPALVLMAANMVAAMFSHGFDRQYPVKMLAVAIVLWCMRRVYLTWDWRPGPESLGAGVIAFALWMLLETPRDGQPLRAALLSLGPLEAGLWLVFRVAGSALFVPVVEELAFRGYLLSRLAGREPSAGTPPPFALVPVAVSSLAFGLLHDRWLAGTLAGVLYAWAYRRGRLADAVAAHATTNALIAIAVLGFGNWGLWL